jgi:hypothetical protein
MHQYTYHPQQGRSIHSSCQLESFANDGNDKLIHIPRGLQRIQTVDGYVFPLSIRDGLSYLGMRPYTDVEYESPSHVITTPVPVFDRTTSMGNIAWEIRHCGCYHDDVSI